MPIFSDLGPQKVIVTSHYSLEMEYWSNDVDMGLFYTFSKMRHEF